MKYFSTQLSNENLYSIHNDITIFLAIVWIAFCFLGFYLSASNKNKITLFLIIFSVTQEIFDYINRFFLNDLYVIKMQTDLPLFLFNTLKVGTSVSPSPKKIIFSKGTCI